MPRPKPAIARVSVLLRLDPSDLEMIDKARGSSPRNQWIVDLIRSRAGHDALSADQVGDILAMKSQFGSGKLSDPAYIQAQKDRNAEMRAVVDQVQFGPTKRNAAGLAKKGRPK